MALIDHIDPTVSPRRIYLSAATVGASIHPIDLYREMRVLRHTNETLRQYDVFMAAFGNVPKGGGKFTERYVRLNNARIVPFDTSHTLTITGTLITDDGFEGPLAFDTTPLTGTTSVNISYIPPQVEIIQVNTGSGLTPDQALQLQELWRLQGLDKFSPMTVTQTSRKAGAISLSISGDGTTTTTVTRQ